MITDDFLNNLPEKPGVYIMKDADGDIIYIGKAKILKNRVRQYFKTYTNHSAKVSAMVKKVRDIEFIITNSEIEALNLECALIKKHRPKYNILLKDDKTYPYIKITTYEEYPRIMLTRKVEKDKAKYFGPFVSGIAVNETIELMKKIFKIRGCRQKLPLQEGKGKGCLNYHIKRCMAPCCDKISKQEYGEMIEGAVAFLNGKFSAVEKTLINRMKLASESLHFEQAATLRDQILSLKKIFEKQVVVSAVSTDEDIICVEMESGFVCVQMLLIREGRMSGNQSYFMQSQGDSKGEILASFIPQYYSSTSDFPKRLLVSDYSEEFDGLEEWLGSLRRASVKIRVPERGDKLKLVGIARKNAKEAINQRIMLFESREKINTEALTELKENLGLNFLPCRVEAFDISNISGSDCVGSMVVFEDGIPRKSQYRKFKLKSKFNSDYEAMREVVYRRFSHVKKEEKISEKDKKFSKLPDVIFVDGGKGHVNAISNLLEEMEIEIPVFGIVKDEKHRTKDIIARQGELNLSQNSKCFRLITSVQDEMHRVAISYHRLLRNKRNLESKLTKIEGVGKVRYNKLMKHFKSLENIKEATVQQINEVEKIDKRTAQKIYNFFH